MIQVAGLKCSSGPASGDVGRCFDFVGGLFYSILFIYFSFVYYIIIVVIFRCMP